MADGLADLPDRQGFARALEAELERSRRGEERFALLLVELDRDAPANASGASGAGRVATALAGSTRLFDVVARVDAGRFAVIVPGADSAGGAVLCERVREALRARGPDCVAVSVGVAHFPDHGGSADSSCAPPSSPSRPRSSVATGAWRTRSTSRRRSTHTRRTIEQIRR